MLRQVLASGTGGRAKIAGYDLAGKTGTTSDYRDAWFVGFTGGFVAAVWVGRDDNTPMKRVTGGGAPAEIWRAFMAAALPQLQAQPIPGGTPAPAARPTPSATCSTAATPPPARRRKRRSDDPHAPQRSRRSRDEPAAGLRPAGAEASPRQSYWATRRTPCSGRALARAARRGGGVRRRPGGAHAPRTAGRGWPPAGGRIRGRRRSRPPPAGASARRQESRIEAGRPRPRRRAGAPAGAGVDDARTSASADAQRGAMVVAGAARTRPCASRLIRLDDRLGVGRRRPRQRQPRAALPAAASRLARPGARPSRQGSPNTVSASAGRQPRRRRSARRSALGDPGVALAGERRRLAQPPRRRRDRQHLALGPVDAQRDPPRPAADGQPHRAPPTSIRSPSAWRIARWNITLCYLGAAELQVHNPLASGETSLRFRRGARLLLRRTLRSEREAIVRDLIIRGGTIVDGTGGAPFLGDIAIDGDRIVAVGEVSGQGRREIDADGHDRHPRLGRHPHPLRRPGDLGSAAGALELARRDHGGDGQLRRRLRAGAARRTTTS